MTGAPDLNWVLSPKDTSSGDPGFQPREETRLDIGPLRRQACVCLKAGSGGLRADRTPGGSGQAAPCPHSVWTSPSDF